jgi:pyruvate dehydrogenase E2 component (dihydrolipoamide acetyltransferase)
MATVQDVLVPDIGDFKDIPVIEVLVKPGDQVEAEAPLVTLESDKATMDVPAPVSGVVKQVKVKVGDKVSQGTLVLTLETAASGGKAAPATPAPPTAPGGRSTTPVEAAMPEKPFHDAAKAPSGREASAGQAAPAIELADPQASYARAAHPPPEHEGPVHEAAAQRPPAAVDEVGFRAAHAGPGVRRLARELGVDLSRVKGQGPKGRILKEDVHAFVKSVLSGGAVAGAPAGASVGLSLPPWPKVDFAKFGPVEQKPLTRVQKIAGPALHRNWVSIPHVTSCDDADVTELEAFRVHLNAEAGNQDKSAVKVTMLAFLVKACVAALQKFPNFNSSLDGENLILKRYYNVAFAADTPQGLLVPVIKDADKKGVRAIAKETAELAGKARDGKLSPTDMQGATFTISSLGGIGGTYFTPIINAPEVAILGVCRAQQRPVWDGEKFAPRLILPLSLSWDHRVLDGAAAARFNVHLAALLADVRLLLL